MSLELWYQRDRRRTVADEQADRDAIDAERKRLAPLPLLYCVCGECWHLSGWRFDVCPECQSKGPHRSYAYGVFNLGSR